MKHDLRIAVTKKMIRDALLQLLEDTPLERITVSRLCDLSGVNRTTFYRHYQTLQDVLREQEAEFIRNAPRPMAAPKTMADINLDESILGMTVKASKDIRDKYVLPRLMWDLGILDEML